MLRRAAVVPLSVAFSAAIAGPAHAADIGVGNGTGCRGSALNVTVCAKETTRTPGSSGGPRSERPAKASGSDVPKCTYKKLVPQPPAENLAMKDGKKRGGKGAVYQVMCPETGRQGVVWVPQGAVPGGPAIDPEVVALRAVDSMKLAPPAIDINPKPGGKGLVGMPVWMSVEQSPTTYGPNSATATAGGVSVTATAKVAEIVWTMGDGTSVTCTGPGTAYEKSFGMKSSPDCGHTYKQTSSGRPGGKFAVKATATWAVHWQVTGGGESGDLAEVREADAELTIIESQAVN